MSAIFAHLDKRGLDYLRDQLADANPLGQRILAEVALDNGPVYTILPGPSLYNFAESISSGAIDYSKPRAITCNAVRERIVTAFQLEPDLALVCESYNLRVSEIPSAVLEGRQVVPYLPGRTGHVGEFIYHFATRSDSEATIESVIQLAYELPVGLAVVFRSSHATFNIRGEDVTPVLDEVISGVVAIAVSAYDGESFVLWQSPEHRVFDC